MPRDNVFLAVIRRKGQDRRSFEEHTQEMSELSRSAGGSIVGFATSNLERPTPNYFISLGKLNEIREQAHRAKANLIIFNVNLSPIQGRNLESEMGIRVIDRTALIIDIFARRAQSRAGRLQVELAQLNYLLPRLVGYGVIMSRTGGGIGTRGPGEQKLEVDRRKIRNRIVHVKKELTRLKVHQDLLRNRRKEKSYPLVALVGYTNAGKSTLLKALTGAQVLIEDKLFATLDPTTRILPVPGKRDLMVTDTVGFLIELPHSLIEAFQATLDEVREADILVHVLDISNPDYEMQHASVISVLTELKAQEKPIVLALNKIDQMDELQVEQIRARYPNSVPVSAAKKQNLNALINQIEKLLEQERL